LEQLGWEVLIADAQKVKGLAPLACKTDRIDARVLAVLSQRDLVPAPQATNAPQPLTAGSTRYNHHRRHSAIGRQTPSSA
jgi:transposase